MCRVSTGPGGGHTLSLTEGQGGEGGSGGLSDMPGTVP